MSATSTTTEIGVQTLTTATPSFTDWKPSIEREPTESDERIAREQSLEIGNVTEIPWRKVPGTKQYHYKRLDDHNRDCYWKYRDEVNMPNDCDNKFKRHILFATAGQVGLSRFQRRRALNRLFRLNLPKFGMRTDVVAFCLCGLILNEDAERYGDDIPYHPARNPENNPDHFTFVESQLIETKGRTNKKYIQKVWGKLSQGNPPTRRDEEWKPFVRTHSKIQNHPSYRPKWTRK